MSQERSHALGFSGRGLQGTAAGPAAQPVTALDRFVVNRLLSLIDRRPFELVLWNGESFGPRGGRAAHRVHIRSPKALQALMVDPMLHFGDLYSAGWIEVEGPLVNFLEAAYGLEQVANGSMRWLQWLTRRRRQSNSLSGSRGNIHHHYDIGNEFYSLWLDREAQQYTCAYYPEPHMTLEQAQVAKLHHVCRKLCLQPGQTVVEAGCGWGGLARFMARHYGVTVKAYNISHEQVIFARDKAMEEGLDDRVEYIEDDYRNISGRYDVFVSVGMLEHVGPENYHQLGEVIDRCLSDQGFGLIHTIGRNQSGTMNAWIEKRIFPGACPPSLSQMMAIFEPRNFSVLDVENLRLHYARTLSHWLERFEEHQDRVRAMFDETFLRAWRLYLCGSIAAFTTGSLQLFQVVFAKGRNNQLPWSRAHLYV